MDVRERELEKIKMHLETLRQIIVARYNIIFTTSVLAAGILVIATFNREILPLSLCETKILVIVLLSLIPISLIDYSLKLSNDANHIMKILGVKLENKKSFFRGLLDGSSYFYVGAITLCIIYIVYSIIKTL